MRKGLVVIAFMSLYAINVSAACTTPTSGTRVWDLAATALDIIDSTESKVCELLSEINTDFNGTFTVEQNMLTKVCDNLTLTEQINSSFDQLIVSLPNTVSKLCIIDSKVDVLTTQIEDLQVDISGTFTALDGLKTTVCSKSEHVSTELNQIETTITLLTQTEIDHAITIASQLSELQTDVDLLNSAIDDLNLDATIQGLDSCVDILVSLVDDLDMDVDNLQSTLANGFAGTFTALDAQLLKACTVESLADTAEVTAMVDFSGVFTALEALQEKVCSIDSLVDIVCLINARDVICSTDSKIDRALSKICLTQEEIVPLPSLTDTVISKLESVEMAGFDQACSKIEVAINILDSIGSKVDTIESKVCVINVLNNTSKLEVLDAELITIDSQLDTIDAMTSKLCIIDSKLDPLQHTALTIESIIDIIDGEASSVDSKIDALGLQSKADLLESKLCEIEPSTGPICSNLDLLLSSLDITESKLDLLIGPAPGSLCLGFGSNGTVTTNFGGFYFASAVVLQSDGKIIAVGGGDSMFALARYTSDGSLDATFGTGGLVSTNFPGPGSDAARGVVLQPDGKIIAVGNAGINFALARYNSDGSLDGTFGAGGLVTTDFAGSSDRANAVVLQPDGKIIAAGSADVGGFLDFALARYNSDGSLDGTFGTGGLVTTDFAGEDDVANAVILQPDGKIIAVGGAFNGDDDDFALARYNSNGSLDATFGTGGLVTTDFAGDEENDVARGVVLQSDGKIIAVGQAGTAAGNNFGLARYNSDGSLDGTFGTGGLVTTSFGAAGARANAVVLQPDGKIITAGQAAIGGALDFGLARYDSDGSLDGTFGTGGLVTTNLGGTQDSALAVVLQPDGKIIAVGGATTGVLSDFALACYETGLLPIWFVKQEVELLCNQIELLSAPTLLSKICLIEDQVCTIESALDVVGGLIGPLNMQAQELIGDFQETWTIVDIIENKLSTAEPILETITSKLDQELSLDLSGVFTEIEAILEKECTVDSKVDSALLLVDEFVSRQDAIDFSSVFTALDALLVKVCTVDSQVDILNSKVDNLVTFCGIPIRASDLPLTITMPERYFLAENIDYAGGGNAITISTDNVFLDLNSHTLNAAAGANNGVLITTSTNVQVTNGAIINFARGIFAQNGCTNVILSDLNFAGNDLSIRESDIRNMIIRDIFCNSGAFLRAVTSDNITITRCTVFGDLVSTGFGAGFTNNLFMSDCVFKKMGGNAVSSVGTLTNILYQRLLIEGGEGGVVETVPGSSGIIVKDCKLIGGSGDGIQLRSAGGGAAINNMIIGYGERGIEVLANTPINQYIAFNQVIECASNFDETAATSNTFLGNFAFNSTAVGDPNNTNYNILGSDITGKFVTVAQDGSFVDRPKYWHNINMLP